MYSIHRKPNSAYAIQYQNFEDRLRGKKVLRHKLPTIMRKDSDALNTDDYLQLAHQLKTNQARICFGEQDKENEVPVDIAPLLEVK